MLPLLIILPSTDNWAPVVVTESPALLRVRFAIEILKSSTVAAVVALITTLSPEARGPLFQLLASLQFVLLPPPPVQVSVVTGGGACLFAALCGAAARASPCWPVRARFASLFFETKLVWARVKGAARSNSTIIHSTAREEDGRMGDSMNSIEFQKQLSSGFFVLTEQTAGADTS